MDLLITIGEGNGYANKIKFKTKCEALFGLDEIPFPADVMMEVLKANEDATEGKLQISQEGLMKISFKEDGIDSTYYLVRLSTNQYIYKHKTRYGRSQVMKLINRLPQGSTKQKKMTQLQPWVIDPFDIVWKNFFDVNSTFNTFENKINYPVDILETENGLRFELAVVGLSEADLDIQVDGDTLRITYEKPETEEIKTYLQKGIAKRSFDLAWKVASKFELSKLDASLDKGLLTLNVPYAPEKAPKKIEIKVNNKKILKG